MNEPSNEVTELLKAWSAGDEEALDRLTPLVYRELHRAAQRYMARQQPDHTLQKVGAVRPAYFLERRPAEGKPSLTNAVV
jgi:RNA polymerase sigma-70 factor, ECF subfamily